MTLPHRYPFRFVEPRADGRAVVRLSASAFWTRGHSLLPLSLIVEAAAQAAAATLPRAEPAKGHQRLYLAGIERCVLERQPAAGETVEIVMKVAASLGPAVLVEGEIFSEGSLIGTLALLLARSASGVGHSR